VYQLTDHSTDRYILPSYTILGLIVLGRREWVHLMGLSYVTKSTLFSIRLEKLVYSPPLLTIRLTNV